MLVSTDNGGFVAFVLATAIWLWWLFLILLVVGWIYDWVIQVAANVKSANASKTARLIKDRD